ncbi:putative ABC transporter ATP-binding protein YbhF [Planctopirus ephydatiae]|jgi:ABC-2 type transport system ATP-binding protein|uniref:Putative ABC transporter ATP-binding protein YbhF n=1 Tax=Planctopirus ephydatiae TaxID=2528019 RepID=A0A518GNK9_9PLAN|nr:ATP-binding cassette domain-containing protein [Planctopirus ephydatiae]QDV30166.1 putative ABC transporter ATP-binding protein YbhF [Planctopirus ephydatiae]
MSIIEAQQLSKSYKVFRKKEGLLGSIQGVFHREYKVIEAVRDVSFSIEKGEMVAFLGANGAGKTTTLKLLSGLIHPTTGEAHVLGHVPWKRENAYRRRFSLVMGQKNQLWWDLPAVESFRLHQEIYRIDKAVYDRRLDELTSLLEVKPLVRQAVRELSLGERMRMELIAALLHAPEVLLLDEPTIGLDVVSQRRVQDFLKFYQQSQQITVILTSHYMKDVQALCKRAIIISGGTLRYDGPLAELVEKFSQYKLLSLQFAGEFNADELQTYGRIIEHLPPRVKLEVPRHNLPELLSNLLARYSIEDLEVQERPLEDVIAEVFTAAKSQSTEK